MRQEVPFQETALAGLRVCRVRPESGVFAWGAGSIVRDTLHRRPSLSLIDGIEESPLALERNPRVGPAMHRQHRKGRPPVEPALGVGLCNPSLPGLVGGVRHGNGQPIPTGRLQGARRHVVRLTQPMQACHAPG